MRALAAVLVAALPLAVAGGELTGRIRYAGPSPKPAPAPVTKDRAVCGDEAPDESLLAAGGGLANAVVRVEGSGAAAPAPARLVLDQRRCRFVPRVLVAAPGSTLEITNADAVMHSAHGWLGPRTAFDVQTPGEGDREAVVLKRPGVVRVACDVHSWMQAFVHVVDGPAAVTGADGSFRLTLAPGSYTVRIWHERLGERTATAVVPASGTGHLDVELGPGTAAR